MSPFGNPFSAADNQPQHDDRHPPDPIAAAFDADWHTAVRRAAVVSGVPGYTLTLRHPETREIMSPHQGLEGVFDDWRSTTSPWTRRCLFIAQILEMGGDILPFWAWANLMNAAGQPQEALKILEKRDPPAEGTEHYAQHAAAYARVLLMLGHVPEGLAWAQAAAGTDPENLMLHVLLADALRLNNQTEEAFAIYSGLMAAATPTPPEAPDPVAAMFDSLFHFETGAVPSPLFAADIADRIEDPLQAEQFWNLAAIEFCDSQHFQMQHAYHWVKVGQVQTACDQLAALVRQRPWIKEASLNLLQLLRHLDPHHTGLHRDLRSQVEQTIREKGWTPEGMFLLQIPAADA